MVTTVRVHYCVFSLARPRFACKTPKIVPIKDNIHPVPYAIHIAVIQKLGSTKAPVILTALHIMGTYQKLVGCALQIRKQANATATP